jgi:hypothetical protein
VHCILFAELKDLWIETNVGQSEPLSSKLTQVDHSTWLPITCQVTKYLCRGRTSTRTHLTPTSFPIMSSAMGSTAASKCCPDVQFAQSKLARLRLSTTVVQPPWPIIWKSNASLSNSITIPVWPIQPTWRNGHLWTRCHRGPIVITQPQWSTSATTAATTAATTTTTTTAAAAAAVSVPSTCA